MMVAAEMEGSEASPAEARLS
jgi:hypothetical protein